jgi:hypothetical protein
MSIRQYLAIGFIAIIGIACSSEQDQSQQASDDTSAEATVSADNPAKSIEQLLKNDQYEEALTRIEQSADMADSTRQRLKEKAHLNYGLFLEYRGGERSMRERMTNALRQFIEVLRINRQNQKALAEIKQIMGIYGTMPENSPPADIKKELNALGVRY